MIIYEMLLAAVLAVILVGILVPSGRYRGDDRVSPAVFFFPLLLLLIWTLGAWITPIGAPVAGVYWLSFVVPAAFLLVFLFALSTPSGPARREGDVVPDNAREEAAAGTVIAFSLFFWALLVAALAALAVHYL